MTASPGVALEKDAEHSHNEQNTWDLCSWGKSLAVVMVADSMPGLKKLLSTTGLKDVTRLLVVRMVVSFLLHAGRMSCLRAAGAVRCEARHRAQISRFLARPRWRELDINSILRQALLDREAVDGLFVFEIDA